MKRQFVIGRIALQRLTSKQMRAENAEDSNARFDTASFSAVPLGLVTPRDYLDRFVAPKRLRRNVRLKISRTVSSCLHIRIPFATRAIQPLPPTRFSGTAKVKLLGQALGKILVMLLSIGYRRTVEGGAAFRFLFSHIRGFGNLQ